MRSASRAEMEYLGSLTGQQVDTRQIRELSRELDALRRYDQHYSKQDWSPSQRIAYPTLGSRSHLE